MSKKARIIVVEDDQANRRSLLRALSREGYDVEAFSEAEGALQYLRGNRDDVVAPESTHEAVNTELHRLAKGLSHDLSGPLRSVGAALAMVEEDLEGRTVAWLEGIEGFPADAAEVSALG